VRLGDLSREHQPDARASRLGGEEGDEQVAGVGEAGAVVLHPDLQGRAVSFETRLAVEIAPGQDMIVQGDPDQLEQVLTNLLRNAADASLSTKGGVKVGWRRDGSMLEIWIKDEGPGLSSTANLFVPFFTTKPGGSGIGLVLSRQIAEGHGGALTLENRADKAGCIARLKLPA
jgi:two-component system, NtrC family, nitrogen regulation sensor histidine kinase NtrY